MRSDPAYFEFAAPENLQTALKLLADQKNAWLPIAGGTDLMVQFAAGALAGRKLLNIWNLPELRRIDVLSGEVQIGAGCTYTDLRNQEVIAREFPLLIRAASWTGGIANQNRGTLGGNIANASPAADSLPMLLVYDAELILVSSHGERRVPYRDFHTGYKQMRLDADELIRAVCLPRIFSEYVSYARKVGARNAQAISKVCIAALGHLDNRIVEDVRIALGSVAPVPIRLNETERILQARRLDAATVVLAQTTAASEIRPISDIRSTAAYRSAVVANLVGEFLENLGAAGAEVVARWNRLPASEAEGEILACCGSREWARKMVDRRPLDNGPELVAASDEIWRGLSESDWMEAFRSHPRIGESRAEKVQDPRSEEWSAHEQRGIATESDTIQLALAQANREYEKRFGHIFIVFATGKSAAELLQILQRRLTNDPSTELQEAAEQQRQITNLRLKKWLAQ